MQLHLHAEFKSLPDLLGGALTGRNYGWLPTERAMPVQTVAQEHADSHRLSVFGF